MNETPIPAPATKRRFRKLRAALLVIVIAVIALAVGVWVVQYSTNSRWDAAVAEVTRLDPRWTLMEIEADRPKVADAENAALFMKELRRKARGVSVEGAPRYDKIFEKLPPNVQLNGQQIELIQTQLARLGKCREEARKLKDMPNGHFPLTYSDDWINTLVTDHQEARILGDWLRHDAFDLAEEGRVDSALESCQALLTAARVFKDDPFLIVLLIRCSLQAIAVETMERVLAQGEPSDDALRATEAILQRELQASGWLAAVRGQRAGLHYLFENIRSGKVSSSVLRGMEPPRGMSPSAWLHQMLPYAYLSGYPEHLRHMTEAVEISKLPVHERQRKLAEWEEKCNVRTNAVGLQFMPSVARVHRAECRSQAWLRSAAVAMACERYRQKHSRWPAVLDELVKEKLIDEVPTDPRDGLPLHYRRTAEGVVIYSIDPKLVDNQGRIDHQWAGAEGYDTGFRLWDLSKRRQPPLPPVAEREGR